ncbi:hypothetical protein QR680_006703 [Steinernema hermaphroditum]|uniref:Uncharacterized protein n=1 Tax=Steinernema hermaphroditum TaxID=289476 RepID=A0AA39HW88_9BILA|nr:hypothetical protein QR680_006703 [Steinernema hermaphroditum]
MNDVPFEFVDSVLYVLTQHTVKVVQKLCGYIGLSAASTLLGCYNHCYILKDGVLDREYCRYQFRTGDHEDLRTTKYLFSTNIHLAPGRRGGDRTPEINQDLFLQIASRKNQRSYFCFEINTSRIDKKWVQLLSSWPRLQELVIHVPIEGPIQELLAKVVRRGSVSLFQHSSRRIGPPARKLIVDLFLQPQFDILCSPSVLVLLEILRLWLDGKVSRGKDVELTQECADFAAIFDMAFALDPTSAFEKNYDSDSKVYCLTVNEGQGERKVLLVFDCDGKPESMDEKSYVKETRAMYFRFR